jgi:hypothetical protein
MEQPVKQLFARSNIDALLTHLRPGDLSAQLVNAVADATDEPAALVAIQTVMGAQLAEERAKLDAQGP